jgi:hypothetical protein
VPAKRHICLMSQLLCQQARATDRSTHVEKYSDHVDPCPTPVDTTRPGHARLPGTLT